MVCILSPPLPSSSIRHREPLELTAYVCHIVLHTGSYAGTSNILVSNIAFVNVTGYVTSSSSTASVLCSTRNPCYNVGFRNISLALTEDGTVEGAVGSCSYIADGGVYGMTGSGCS